MSIWSRYTWFFLFASSLMASHAFAETPAPAGYAAPSTASPDGAVTAKAPARQYRTWISVQRYNMEHNGEVETSISNVRLEVSFPNGQKLQLPEGGQYWPIGNGQVQEINRNYEVPFAWISNDGFKFTIQMVRKGSDMLPCQFDVSSLSQFNRSYVCRTDTAWQTNQRVPSDRLDREGIQIRVFTDLNSKSSEIPTDSIALK